MTTDRQQNADSHVLSFPILRRLEFEPSGCAACSAWGLHGMPVRHAAELSAALAPADLTRRFCCA